MPVPGRHQGGVVGMTPDIAGDKRAERDHRKVLRARVVQRSLHQLAGDAVTFQLVRHFSMGEEDRIAAAPIFSHGELSINAGFPAMGASVVFYFQVVQLAVGHGSLSSGGSNWPIAPAIRTNTG